MKITEPLNFHTSAVDQRLKIGVPQLRPIKFIEYLPMRLRDRVAGKTSKQIEKPCFSEMIQLFTCFGKKDFETTGCPKEVAELNTCWSQHVASTRAKKKMSREDMPIAGQTARELTVRQVNSMLKKWPVGHLIKNAKRV